LSCSYLPKLTISPIYASEISVRMPLFSCVILMFGSVDISSGIVVITSVSVVKTVVEVVAFVSSFSEDTLVLLLSCSFSLILLHSRQILRQSLILLSWK